MNERTTPNITIYRKIYSGGLAYDEAQVTVPITPACRRVCKLMSEDSITLSFSLSADDIYQPCIGDRAHDEVFGDFYLAQEALAEYNKSTGGYDYNLTFVKDYWLWNNRILSFAKRERNYIPDEQGIIDPWAWSRGETSWMNTDTLAGHCSMIKDNLSALEVSVTFDITARYKDEVRFISYDHIKICDAMTAIANEYECEWWVTENGNARVIHFGKCEAQSGQPYDFLLGVNVESMSVSRDQNEYANCIAAYGSTKNLPYSYRKTLTFEVTDTETQTSDPIPWDIDPDWDEEGRQYEPPGLDTSIWMFRDINKAVTLSMLQNGKAKITYKSGNQTITDVVHVEGHAQTVWLSFELGANPGNLTVGKEFTLNIYDPESDFDGGLVITKIPDAWWLDDMDNPSSLKSLGERRLMLPNNQVWITPTDNEPKGKQVVESVVVFENIYPRNFLRVRQVYEKEMTPDNEELPDGSQKSWTWVQYDIEVENLDGSDFPFRNAYRTKDTELEVMFLSEIDEQNAYGAGWQDLGNLRLLAGMNFKVDFNDSTKLYTISRNEDYGAKLPNSTLKPSANDVLVLVGWDVKAMGSLGLVEEAELRLAREAQKYVDAVQEGQWTFGCNMMSHWPTLLAPSGEDYGLPNLGDRVTVHHDALRIWRQDMQEFIAAKTSRIIGWTAKLDFPYDTLEVTVGETEAFSRIKAMERAMSGQGKGVSTSVVEESSEIIITITGAAVIIGTQYSGLASSVSDVVWSVVSNTYATINSSSGVLTIKEGAFGNSVTIRATKDGNYGELTVKVYYSTLDTATFDEVSVVDVTSNLRNGSPGNANNAYRVCPTQTIAVNGYKNIYITTSRPNKTGYQYYVNVQLSTLAAGSTTNGNFGNTNTKYICEMGRYGSTQDAPAAKLMPLTEVSDFIYACVAKPASGQTPVSFGYNIQESTDSYYSHCSSLRTTSFTNEIIEIHFFK